MASSSRRVARPRQCSSWLKLRSTTLRPRQSTGSTSGGRPPRDPTPTAHPTTGNRDTPTASSRQTHPSSDTPKLHTTDCSLARAAPSHSEPVAEQVEFVVEPPFGDASADDVEAAPAIAHRMQGLGDAGLLECGCRTVEVLFGPGRDFGHVSRRGVWPGAREPRTGRRCHGGRSRWRGRRRGSRRRGRRWAAGCSAVGRCRGRVRGPCAAG